MRMATKPSSSQVLATLEEDSYAGGTMGDDHPIVWCQELGNGRSAQIGMGTMGVAFSETLLRTMVGNPAEWLAGETQGDSKATLPARYQTTTLAAGLDPARCYYRLQSALVSIP